MILLKKYLDVEHIRMDTSIFMMLIKAVKNVVYLVVYAAKF